MQKYRSNKDDEHSTEDNSDGGVTEDRQQFFKGLFDERAQSNSEFSKLSTKLYSNNQPRMKTRGSDSELVDHPVRVSFVGNTGNGKSTLSNAILLGPEFHKESLFPMSSESKSCTQKSNYHKGTFYLSKRLPKDGFIEVIDNPGSFDKESVTAAH